MQNTVNTYNARRLDWDVEMPANILIVYSHRYTFPMRQNVRDHLYSFVNHSKHRIFYLNTAFGVPRYVFRVHFDLVIFHTIFLSNLKWSRASYSELIRRVSRLKHIHAVKIILPQDEFIRTDVICQFINDFRINAVFSTAEQSEWGKIYPTVDRSKVEFATVLTGYLEDNTVKEIQNLSKKMQNRPIDIGYRACKVPYWLGSHGYLKRKIAEVFKKYTLKRKLKIDISTEEKDIFFGFSWYRFLLNCKYFIGAESGSSILDSDGSIRDKVESYLIQNPKASFEKVEEACFKGLDGNLGLFTISPRHLEACATKTCQVLIEGYYNGILKPNFHYIPIKNDFSNINEVLKIIEDDFQREKIVEQAYKDIIQSRKFTYGRFVDCVLKICLAEEKTKSKSFLDICLYHYNFIREWFIWKIILIESYCIRLAMRALPASWIRSLRLLKYRLRGDM